MKTPVSLDQAIQTQSHGLIGIHIGRDRPVKPPHAVIEAETDDATPTPPHQHPTSPDPPTANPGKVKTGNGNLGNNRSDGPAVGPAPAFLRILSPCDPIFCFKVDPPPGVFPRKFPRLSRTERITPDGTVHDGD